MQYKLRPIKEKELTMTMVSIPLMTLLSFYVATLVTLIYAMFGAYYKVGYKPWFVAIGIFLLIAVFTCIFWVILIFHGSKNKLRVFYMPDTGDPDDLELIKELALQRKVEPGSYAYKRAFKSTFRKEDGFIIVSANPTLGSDPINFILAYPNLIRVIMNLCPFSKWCTFLMYYKKNTEREHANDPTITVGRISDVTKHANRVRV